MLNWKFINNWNYLRAIGLFFAVIYLTLMMTPAQANLSIEEFSVLPNTLISVNNPVTASAYIQDQNVDNNTPVGINVNVTPVEGINVSFANVTQSGQTSVDVLTTGPSPPSEFNMRSNYYDINTTAKHTGDVTVCINYDDSDVNDENTLRLFQNESGEYEFLGYVQTDIDLGDTTWDLTSATHPSILYYDFDEGEGDEQLHFVIDGPNREINGTNNSENFVYRTSIYYTDDNPTEPYIAWLGEPYFVIEAGSDWYLSKLLVDEGNEDTHILNADESLYLPEGFSVTPVEIDVDGEKAWFVVRQDGVEVESLVVDQGELFEYETDLNESGYDDNWVLRFYVETVFAGMNMNLVELSNIQLLDPDVVKIETPNDVIFENFEIKSVNNDQSLEIRLDGPDDKISLKKGGIVSLLGERFNFRINEDGDVGTIVVKISDPGIYELFAAVKQSIDTCTSEWHLTSATHPSIMYYDFDKGEGDEQLHFMIDGPNREINGTNNSENFVYRTSIYYKADHLIEPYIAWLGEPYFVIESGSDWYLSKLLVDEGNDDTHILNAGESLYLPAGFSVNPIEIDVGGGKARFVVRQDGVEVENLVIDVGKLFEYETDLNESGSDDNWVLRFYVENVSVDTNSVKINGTQLLSPHVLKIETPDDDTFENFEIDSVNNDQSLEIRLDSIDDKISLKKDGIVSLLGDTFNFRINEDGDVGGILKIANVSTWSDVTTSVDINANIIRGTVTHLSEFIVAEPKNITSLPVNNTPAGINVQVNISCATLTFSNVTQSGQTSVDVLTTGPSPPSEFNMRSNYYDISTTARYADEISVCIGYDDSKVVDETNLKMLHYEKTEDENEIFACMQENISSYDTEWNLTAATYPDVLCKGSSENLYFVIDGPRLEINGSGNNFVYNTSIFEKEGEPFITWLGEPYFVIENRSDWYLSKMLVDEGKGDTHILNAGESLYLPEGFSVNPIEIDVGGGKAWFVVMQDGVEVENLVVDQGELFEYETDLNESGSDDNWVLRFYVENVSVDTNSVKINMTQLLSPNVLKIETPDTDTFNNFEIDSTNNDNTLEIRLDHPDDNIELIQGGVVHLIDDMFRFKIDENGDIGGILKRPNVTGLWNDVTSSLDTQTNTICGVVTNLSEFIIAESVGAAVITGPPDQSIELGAAGNITWNIIKMNPDKYWVLRNGTEIVVYPADYQSGIDINVPIDTSMLGVWNYTIFANDTSGNITSDQVNITVQDTTPPAVTNLVVTPHSIYVNESVNISVDVTDAGQIAVNASITYPNGSVSEFPMFSSSSYSLDFNHTSQYGIYDITIIAKDVSGNINDTVRSDFVVAYHFTNQSVNTTANETSLIDAYNKTRVTLEFVTNQSMIWRTINITRSPVNITGTSILEEPNLGIFTEITVSNELKTNLTWCKFKIFYTDADVEGFVEESLFLYVWNETSFEWEKLIKGIPPCVDTGVNTAENYIWANLTHFSIFTVGATPTPTPTSSRNGGGGGGSGGGASGEGYKNILISETEREYVKKDSKVCYTFDLEGNIVKHINFTGLTSAGRVAAKVEILNNTSTMVDHAPPDIVYKNLNIWIGNQGWATSSNIAHPTINFKVEKSWVVGNNIDDSTIKMYRYSDRKWNQLDTTKIGEDAGYLYFEAVTASFSAFVITGKKVAVLPGDENIVPEPTTIKEEKPTQPPGEIKPGLPGYSLFAGFLAMLFAVKKLQKKK